MNIYLNIQSHSQCPDLAVVLFHVACVLVYDRVESAVFGRLHDVIIICDVDDGRIVDVVPFGLLSPYIVSKAASTLYGVRQASGKYDARPDLKAGGKILLAALAAAVPTLGLIQLDGAGVGVVNLVIGGLLYLGVYLTLAPILGAVEKQDIMNLRTLLGGTRIVAVLVNPVFDYESKLLSTVKRK